MGPAPMIRMVEISVLLGIKSRGQEIGHKKRARLPRVPQARRQVTLARGWSLDQIPQPRKGLKAPINRHFWGPPSLFELRRGRAGLPSRSCGSSEGWRTRLDLYQAKEPCTALAS